MNADSIKIESDEDGFHLIVDFPGGRFNFRIQDVAEELYDSVTYEIGPWLHERNSARGTGIHVTPEDIDAYEPNDPKRVELERVIDQGGWA
jgi:hypothetical protein